jgi:hypothetical protein
MDDAELVNQLCAELRRLSVNGVAPSISRYDQQRDRALPASWRITLATGLSWEEIVALSGLRLSKTAQRRAAENASVPPEVERDIAQTMPRNRALDSLPEVAMSVVESSRRVREFYVRERDGTVRRIVQESVSLR